MKKNKQIKRRTFLKTCLTASAAAAFPMKEMLSPANRITPDPKGIPTRLFGKTGVRIPLIVFGAGSRFCTVKDPEESVRLLNHALDNGFYYWDTAHDYVYDGVASEERLGLVLKHRRDEVFLATKVGERSYDGAMRQLEESLKRLETDRLDLYQIHLIASQEDVDSICAKDGVLNALYRLKEQGVARFIGLTGHLNADAMTALLERGDFDTMLIALNHYQGHTGDFERGAMPAAARKDMGVLAMKVIRPQETVPGVVPAELIRYALSLEHVHAAVIGTDSMEVLHKNIELARNFKKMNDIQRERMDARLKPFFGSPDLEWMDPEYTDGIPLPL